MKEYTIKFENRAEGLTAVRMIRAASGFSLVDAKRLWEAALISPQSVLLKPEDVADLVRCCPNVTITEAACEPPRHPQNVVWAIHALIAELDAYEANPSTPQGRERLRSKLADMEAALRDD